MSHKPINSALAIPCVLLCLIGAAVSPRGFAAGYLIGYLYWLGISLGALGMLEVHALSGGKWGEAVGKDLERLAHGIPLLSILALPLLYGLWAIYPWALGQGSGAASTLERFYLNRPLFAFRLLFYLLCWNFCLRDYRAKKNAGLPLEAAAARGLVILLLTVTFSSVDWVMSLSPHWYSTVYGAVFSLSDALAGYACACLLWCLSKTPSSGEPQTEQLRWSHAKLIVALILLLLYLSYSQYIIVWMGNIPEETVWYVSRTKTGWAYLAAVLLVLEYFIPFCLLLFCGWKRPVLIAGTALLLITRLFDLMWLIAPSAGLSGLSDLWPVIPVLVLAGTCSWHAAHQAEAALRGVDYGPN